MNLRSLTQAFCNSRGIFECLELGCDSHGGDRGQSSRGLPVVQFRSGRECCSIEDSGTVEEDGGVTGERPLELRTGDSHRSSQHHVYRNRFSNSPWRE